MGFDFDPSIILATQTHPQGPTLGDILSQNTQRQTQQAQLQQTLYNQQRQRGLADLVSQNAGAYSDPYAHALAQGGYGQEAFDAQQRSFQMGQQYLTAQRALTASQLTAADTPAKARKVLDSMSPLMVSAYGKPDKDASDADVMAYRDAFRNAQLSPEQQAELQVKRDALDKDRYGVTTSEATGAAYKVDKTKGTVTTLGGGAAQAQVPLDTAAKQYLQTGEMPDLGRDPAGLLHKAIIKRAYELEPNANVAANKASYKADSGSLEHAQQQADAVNGFTRTFDKNAGVLRSALDKLNSSNSPFANRALRYLEKNGTGDPNFTAFNNALNTVRSELGKINSGSTGQGGVPISVLQEMEEGLPADATPKQVMAALEVYRKDSENRRAAMQEQIGEIKSRMGGKKSGPARGAATGITHVRTVNGETRGWNGKAWVPVGGGS